MLDGAFLDGGRPRQTGLARDLDPLRVKGFGIGGLDPVDRAGVHAILGYVRNARQSTVRSGEDLAKLVAAERVHLGDPRRCLPTF